MKISVTAPQDLTQLLINWRKGDKAALDQMTPALYEELRRLARFFLAGERPDHTLQPTRNRPRLQPHWRGAGQRWNF
jgi:hypothetical protein